MDRRAAGQDGASGRPNRGVHGREQGYQAGNGGYLPGAHLAARQGVGLPPLPAVSGAALGLDYLRRGTPAARPSFPGGGRTAGHPSGGIDRHLGSGGWLRGARVQPGGAKALRRALEGAGAVRVDCHGGMRGAAAGPEPPQGAGVHGGSPPQQAPPCQRKSRQDSSGAGAGAPLSHRQDSHHRSVP